MSVRVITYDFETYYDREYSLSKMTTEAYIRDKRFETIGVAIKVDSTPTLWHSGNYASTKNFLSQFPWEDPATIAVAHNAIFDAAILNWVYNIAPARLSDTLSLARAVLPSGSRLSLASLVEHFNLGVKGNEVIAALGKRRRDFTPTELSAYAEYCINDVELTYRLFKLVALAVPRFEHRLLDLTLKMFSDPVLTLDAAALQRHLDAVRTEKENLLRLSGVSPETLMSSAKFAALLEARGVPVPMKPSPSDPSKSIPALSKTDEGMKALLEHEQVSIQTLAAARLGIRSTQEEARTERLLAVASRGSLPVPLAYYAAHTGRWGGADKINLQNLKRTSPIKKAITAPDGYVIIDCDSSQIEARVLAWIAGQRSLLEAFQRNDAEVLAGVPTEDRHNDPYKIMAAQIYNIEPFEVSLSQRFIGKTTVLGAGYGMGGPKFYGQNRNQVTLDEAMNIIATYRRTFKHIPAFWRDAQTMLAHMYNGEAYYFPHTNAVYADAQGVVLPNAMRVSYPLLNFEGNEFTYMANARTGVHTKIYGGKVTENICQALARIIIGEQMLAIAARYKVVLTVHDAVVALVPEEQAEEGAAFIAATMRTAPGWAKGLPLNCEYKVGRSYGA